MASLDCATALPEAMRVLTSPAETGAVTIALTGFDGGELRLLADECVHVATPPGDYGPVEDMHLIFGHLVSSYLARLTAGSLTKTHLLTLVK
jgi:D-sedoheptulose 7-phosphate isomerase